MLWRGRQGSSNVNDRRGASGGSIAAGGGVGAIIIALLYMFLGGDPSQAPQLLPGQNSGKQLSAEEQAAEDTMAQFIGVVLKETEDMWNSVLQNYQEPQLDLFRGSVQSACGGATSASGPFYCPGDNKIYIDLAFYDDLRNRFGAPGDFAMAYVVAHEVGHHVQNLMGTSDKVQQMRQRVSQKDYNKLSVKLELQADFYAGVWAHYAQNRSKILERGDIEEALRAANAIGDDRLQKQAQGHVTPDAFTHGTSAQRMYWFKKGFETGDIKQGNTFESDEGPR
jgi:predicted metalloprotease